MRISSKTDVGKVRSINEDAYASGELPGGIVWAVVCDGMGGANGGNIASATAVKVISEQIANSFHEGLTSFPIKDILAKSINEANQTVNNLANTVESLRGMGTTVVCVIVRENVAYIAHAGDSRAYLISSENITQVTKDHSLVQTMIERGQINEDEASTHPKKNMITRALGIEPIIEIDFTQVKLEEYDAILICTDGLTNYLCTDSILDIINKTSFFEYPDALINNANDAGGGDNITVVVISN